MVGEHLFSGVLKVKMVKYRLMQAQHDEMPNTWAKTKDLVRSLRAQLGAGKPVPKTDPQPVGGPQPKIPFGDKPIKPATPPNVPPGGYSLDLSAMAPAAFERFIGERNDSELVALLSAENSKPARLKSDRLVNLLYKEIKRRRA